MISNTALNKLVILESGVVLLDFSGSVDKGRSGADEFEVDS